MVWLAIFHPSLSIFHLKFVKLGVANRTSHDSNFEKRWSALDDADNGSVFLSLSQAHLYNSIDRALPALVASNAGCSSASQRGL